MVDSFQQRRQTILDVSVFDRASHTGMYGVLTSAIFVRGSFLSLKLLEIVSELIVFFPKLFGFLNRVLDSILQLFETILIHQALTHTAPTS
jgi:hypothetical protein